MIENAREGTVRNSKKTRQWTIVSAVALALVSLLTTPAAAEGRSRLDAALDKIIEREQALMAELQQYEPLVETYMQTVRPDSALGWVPVDDQYFVGRLKLTPESLQLASRPKRAQRNKLLTVFDQLYDANYRLDSFARMMILDGTAFNRTNYKFEFVRPEFLGEVRALVFEVVPTGRQYGRFTGRIWVEDENFSIVRFNGIYNSSFANSLHFDSWRLNIGEDKWYPAYIYTEQELNKRGQLKEKYKGQTRIWGFEVQSDRAEDEFTKVMIEADSAKDDTMAAGTVSPVMSLRRWEREAEDNVLRRLEKAGLLARDGEVNKVLETVATNLEVTNDLNIDPPVRCRVLMTTPLESFTIGHTIVLSRGLIDVLPDEASLAMAIAHEMGHILSGHQIDTKYAFSDEMLVGDKTALDTFFFKRDPAEDVEADEKAIGLLMSSPYADKLQNAGLFLKALSARAEVLPALIRPHFGNHMAEKGQLYRMPQITDQAPDFDPLSIEQTAALPLGGRVRVSPWDGTISLMTNNRVALLSAREKLPFQVTPLMPHLARVGEDGATFATAEAQPEPQPSTEESTGEETTAAQLRDPDGEEQPRQQPPSPDTPNR